MRRDRHFRPLAFWLAASLTLTLAGSATAQPAAAPGNTPNAMQGFSKNRDQPVQIDAATLEVRDKDKVATFSGNVHVIQGDVHMRCQTLVVFYEGDASTGGTAAGGAKPAAGKSTLLAAQPGPEGQSRIKRLEARGSVVVTQNDQVASGNLGVFDMPKNTVTLTGNVVVSQGKNVSRGEKLTVDMTTGTSRMEGGRVRMLIDPAAGKDLKKDKDGAAAPAPGAASGPKSLSPQSLSPPAR
jgi:lipopolysaccharide export system protein LptA